MADRLSRVTRRPAGHRLEAYATLLSRLSTAYLNIGFQPVIWSREEADALSKRQRVEWAFETVPVAWRTDFRG
jgi:hypothetical protein